LQSGEIVTKYQWSSPTDEVPVYGLNDGTQGVWMIRGGNEYLNGGPTKQHNTCHATDKGPIILNLLYSNHYGSRGSYVSGTWEKLFGPTYVYLNQSTEADSLWQDAKQEGQKMREAWPYTWMDHPEYPVIRASVRGQFPNIDTGWVLLARPYSFRGLDWQQQGGDSYTYRSRINADGSFNIPAVRKGTYTLYAFSAGIVGEYYKDGIEVDSTGETRLGSLPWKSRSYGKLLWRIGAADRSAAEFKHGDDHYHWGLWFNYLNDFPDDVDFIVGESQEGKDWNYGHMAMWMENGGWKPKLDGSVGDGEWKEPVWKISFIVDDTLPEFATLSMGLAGVSREANLHLRLNGKTLVSFKNLTDDSSIHRNGIYGFFRERVYTFDASLLNTGENVLELELEIVKLPNNRTNYSFGLMYDYIQLEIEEKVNSGILLNTDARVKIYPNPAEDILYIQFPPDIQSAEMRLFNITGQKMMSKILDENNSGIQLPSLAGGLYITEVEADGIVYKNKILIR
jgi:rhamnogalacturonan endolyase